MVLLLDAAQCDFVRDVATESLQIEGLLPLALGEHSTNPVVNVAGTFVLPAFQASLRCWAVFKFSDDDSALHKSQSELT